MKRHVAKPATAEQYRRALGLTRKEWREAIALAKSIVTKPARKGST